jgi:D-hydroxyproline dehydrogenase subunit gamma
MFKHYSQEINRTVTIDFEGILINVPGNITVAAAVLSHTGKNHTRFSPVNGEKRAPYCFIGVCHECLMEIDGIPDQQACIIEVKEGMKIRRQPALSRGGV